MDPQNVDYIVIHCSATPPSRDIGRHDINIWHKQRGWLKVGYHFIIRRDGTIEEGRKLDEVGAHVKGYNTRSIGICMVGGVDELIQPEDNFTLRQWEALDDLLSVVRPMFPDAETLGHRDMPNTNKACPSFDVREWLANKVREAVPALLA